MNSLSIISDFVLIFVDTCDRKMKFDSRDQFYLSFLHVMYDQELFASRMKSIFGNTKINQSPVINLWVFNWFYIAQKSTGSIFIILGREYLRSLSCSLVL